MLGVEVLGLNLNEGKRYFDIQMKTYYASNYGVNQDITEIMLEAFTIDQWNCYP